MRLKISKKNIVIWGDYWLSVTAVMQSLILLIQLLLGDAGIIDKDAVSLLRVLVSGVFVVIAMFWILQRKPLVAIASYILMTLLLIFSIFISPDNKDFVLAEGFRFTLCICMPIFLSVISIKNECIFHQVCFWVCILCTIVGVAYGILFLMGQLPLVEKMYNMSYGYALLFPAMYFLYRGTNICNIFAFILFVLILFCGSRGAIVPIIFFFLWKMGISGTSRTRLILFLLLLFVFFTLPFLLSYLSNIGIESRTLFLLVTGEVDNSSGRDELYSVISQKIQESPFLGYGVFGDRPFLDNSYCHNIIYELCVDFGIFFSMIFLLFLLFFFFDAFRGQNVASRDFIILCCLSAMLPLMISSSYLIYFY